jgi:hypothetical protein
VTKEEEAEYAVDDKEFDKKYGGGGSKLNKSGEGFVVNPKTGVTKVVGGAGG